MVEIEKLETESFESNKQYLDRIKETLEGVYNPAVIYLGNQKYVVDASSPVFGAVTEIDGELRTFATALDENEKLHHLLTDAASYTINLDDDIPLISKRDTINNDIEQLFLVRGKENFPRDYMHFYRLDSASQNEIELQYDVTQAMNRLNSYLQFLNNHTPNIAILHEYRRILNLIGYRKQQGYVKLESGDGYSKVLLDLKNYYTLLKLKEIPYTELTQYFQSLGLKSRVPEDLISLYTGTSQIANDLETISKTYKNQMLGQ